MQANSLKDASHICLTCAQGSATCCVTNPQTAHLSFPLSEKEWGRIRAYDHLAKAHASEPNQTNLGKEYGRKPEHNSPDFVQALLQLFTNKDQQRILQLFPADAQHYRLNTTNSGACVFLGSNGCALPRETRPWYCRLFPLWYHGGEILIFHMEECLVSATSASPIHAMHLLDMSKENCLALYYNLRNDWGL